MKKQEFIIKAAKDRRKKAGRRKRILLINPPYSRPLNYLQSFFNLGLGSLSSVMQKLGYDVAIYNAELELDLAPLKNYAFAVKNNYRNIKKFLISDEKGPFWDELEEVIKGYDPWLIGISTLTNKNAIVHKIAKYIKNLNPDVKICLGGHHPTMFPLETMSNKYIDFVITGEAEIAIKHLLNYLSGKIKSIHSMPNIFYRDNGNIKGFIKKERIQNIDNFSFPSKVSLLGYEEMPSSWFSGIITSRGCPFSCTYCGTKNIFDKKLIVRSPKNVIEEITNTNNQLGVNHFYFCDDTFNINREHTIKVAEKIGKYSNGISWECNLRLDLIDEEQLDIFKKNGCDYIWVGIESGSERILREIKKGYDKKVIREQVKKIRKSGIPWAGYFMIGFPQETKDEMLQSLEFMEELKPNYAQINICNPLPGTELYSNFCKNNRMSSRFDWSLQSQANLKNLHLLTKDKTDIENFVIRIIEKYDKYNLKF